MPRKFQHKKGKHPSRSKKGKDRQHFSATATQQPAVAQTYKPAPGPSMPAPSTSVPPPMVKPSAIEHPYVAAELRTIGILAGIILIVLVILASVLP